MKRGAMRLCLSVAKETKGEERSKSFRALVALVRNVQERPKTKPLPMV